MPLEIEQYSRARQNFVKVGTIGQADAAQVIFNHKGNGDIEAIEAVIFECAPDDSGSTVFRSRRDNIDEREIIKRLDKGESFGMAIVRRSMESVLYNITHR